MDHKKFIRSLPCCNCRANPPTECAHIRKGTGGGIGLKPDDKWTVPLCHDCHAKQHQVGEVSFWNDLDKAKWLAMELKAVSGDWKSGVTKVLRFVKCQRV